MYLRRLDLRLILFIGLMLKPFPSVAEGRTLLVRPGDSIPTALRTLAAEGGGLCLLEPGVHLVSQTLLLDSKITLAGVSHDSVVKADTTLTGPVIGALTNRERTLYGVTLSNFTVDGAIPWETQNLDPTYHTQNKSHALRGRYGILMEDSSVGGPISNLSLVAMQVRSAAMGVHVKGCFGLRIAGCRFASNGLIHGFYHNLYLRRDFDVVVRGNQLLDSPTGNGLNVSFSSNLWILDNEASRNGFRGIRAADSFAVHVLSNRVFSNRSEGIVLNREKEPVTGFSVLANRSIGNGKEGILLLGSRNGSVYGNHSVSNLGRDLRLEGTSRVSEKAEEP